MDTGVSMYGGGPEHRDQLNVSRRVKQNRNDELSRVVRHKRGRNIVTPWHAGRKPPVRVKSSAYRLGLAVGASHAV